MYGRCEGEFINKLHISACTQICRATYAQIHTCTSILHIEMFSADIYADIPNLIN